MFKHWPYLGPSRAERLRSEGSPPYRAKMATITAGVTVVVNLETTSAARFLPYNRLVVTNNSDVELTVTVEFEAFRILAREERTIENIFFRSFTVKNEDGATATGTNTIEYVAERQPPDADSVARDTVRARGG